MKIAQNGTTTTVAGSGVSGFSGDGGPATAATFSIANGIALDGTGNLYIADTINNRIRKVTPSEIVSTVAGNGIGGFTGDGGPATQAQLNHPQGVVLDTAGNLYIADYNNHGIREVTPSGVISTIFGGPSGGGSITGSTFGSFGGDGGPALSGRFSGPIAVAADLSGNLYIAGHAQFSHPANHDGWIDSNRRRQWQCWWN